MRKGAGTPAISAVQRAGVDHRVHVYDHNPAQGSYGEEAAASLGLDPARVFKTLVVSVDGALAVAVVPVAGQLDLKRIAAACGGKRAIMADPRDAERATGYVLGGISPLGQRTRLPTVVDSSALAYDRVFVSAGRRGLEIELSPEHLIRLTEAATADIGR